MKRLFLAAIAFAFVSSVSTVAATTEADLQDTWIDAFPKTRTDDMLGQVRWMSMTFSAGRAVTWRWEREGKSESHAGHYTLEPLREEGQDFIHKTSVIIVPTSLAVRGPIVLKKVYVGPVNLFPGSWTVLSLDIGGNRMLFLRDRNYKEFTQRPKAAQPNP